MNPVTPARFDFSMNLDLVAQCVDLDHQAEGIPSLSRSAIRRSKIDSHALLRAKFVVGDEEFVDALRPV